ncbi:glutathione S-transferase family protein [Nitrospirillum sp. BR 11752]|uniref:glutathione S-transferase family protein n=1 Tax=Nitrospirillum sp. BR 11752 TaxID=3104293 RepID=UPI002EB158F0|nr:glutathione S-transferase family protein [Nitrospirillum sp. BR 11752]
MKLYGAALSPYSARVMLAIRAKGLDIPLTDPPGGQKSAAFLAINPLGKTPVLEVDGAYIIESAVICEFLEDAFPTPPLLPGEPPARAAQRTVARLLDLYVLPPLLSLMAQTGDAAAGAARLSDLTRGLDALETVVGRGPPPPAADGLLGLADCALAPTLIFLERFLPRYTPQDMLEGRPALAARWAAYADHPLVIPVARAMETALEAFRQRRG